MELLDKSLMERMPVPTLYTTTLTVLEYLNDNGYKPAAMRCFEAKLLKSLGYQPVLEHCVACGENSGKLLSFSLSQGGLLCPNCSVQTSIDFTFNGESLAILRLLYSSDIKILGRVKASEAALQNLELFLEKYLEYHLERRCNMKKTIRLLKIPDLSG